MMTSAEHDTETADCTAIILAAGSGSRAGSPPDGDQSAGQLINQEKQFCWKNNSGRWPAKQCWHTR